MTDTFASGSHAPSDPPPSPPASPGDVTGTLAELERKLRELEHELSSIGRRRPVPADAPTAPALSGAQGARGAPAVPPREDPGSGAADFEPVGRLIDEAVESLPQNPVARAAAASPPFTPPSASVPPPSASVPVPSAPPSLPVIPTAATPPPVPGPAPQPTSRPASGSLSTAQLASLAELRRFRDRVERFARELTAEYDEVLGRVMVGLSSGTVPDPGSTEASPTSAPTPPLPPPPAAPAPPPSPDDQLYSGKVELGVGPFYDIDSLSSFERRLAAIPHASGVSVRRFEASHAVVDVHLDDPVALIRELRGVLDVDFEIRGATGNRIALTFDDA